jgi:hypothetical protein
MLLEDCAESPYLPDVRVRAVPEPANPVYGREAFLRAQEKQGDLGGVFHAVWDLRDRGACVSNCFGKTWRAGSKKVSVGRSGL